MTAENTEQTTEDLHATVEPEIQDPESSGDVQETDTTDPAELIDAVRNPNREAAKYRRQLRDVEEQLSAAQAEVTTQAEQITAMQRTLVEQQISEKVYDPTDFWTHGGVELSDLINDDGLPDTAQVDKTLRNMFQEKPHLDKLAQGLFDPHQGGGNMPRRAAARHNPVDAYFANRFG